MDAGSSDFFLINLDASVTPAAAMAGLATGGPPVDRLTLGQAMGLSPQQVLQFTKWLDLVRARHRNIRWEKLATLAPILDIAVGPHNEGRRLQLLYRKLLDRDENLTAILVMGIDATPGRLTQVQLEEEKQRHKLEIRDVLALSSNPPETLGAFLNDAGQRLEHSRQAWDAYLNSYKVSTAAKAGLWRALSGTTETTGQHLFRELHMIKGNAGAFGFDGLAALAQHSENLLEGLKNPATVTDLTLAELTSALTELRIQLEEIRRALKQVAGEGQDAMTRILKWKMDRLSIAAADVNTAKLDPQLLSLVEATRRLPFLSPNFLARKYLNLVERIALNLGKRVLFRVASNTGDIHPEAFSRVDEALVHILRNMVDHGIETPAERVATGKGVAEIELEYVTEEDRVFLRIRDDGHGMDANAIADRGVALGLVTRTQADALDEVGKLGLIFLERFTTRHAADLISGRGLGLALAARCVSDQGGNIYVFSRLGEGTRFAIELPHIGKKMAPDIA